MADLKVTIDYKGRGGGSSGWLMLALALVGILATVAFGAGWL